MLIGVMYSFLLLIARFHVCDLKFSIKRYNYARNCYNLWKIEVLFYNSEKKTIFEYKLKNLQ